MTAIFTVSFTVFNMNIPYDNKLYVRQNVCYFWAAKCGNNCDLNSPLYESFWKYSRSEVSNICFDQHSLKYKFKEFFL